MSVSELLGEISITTLVIGAIVVIAIALVTFVAELRNGLWQAIKKFVGVLIRNFP